LASYLEEPNRDLFQRGLEIQRQYDVVAEEVQIEAVSNGDTAGLIQSLNRTRCMVF
jgi:hypothetical protein